MLHPVFSRADLSSRPSLAPEGRHRPAREGAYFLPTAGRAVRRGQSTVALLVLAGSLAGPLCRGAETVAPHMQPPLAPEARAVVPQGVSVAVHRGVATLTGTMPSVEQKRLVLEAAMKVRNVREVVDQLTVSPPARGDAEITEAIRQALSADPTLGTDGLEISVQSGAVLLRGVAGDWQQRDLTAWIAGKVAGVRSVENTIRLPENTRPDEDLAREIGDEFVVELGGTRLVHTSTAADGQPAADGAAYMDPPAVSVRDGVATLSGQVPSLSVREVAERMAASTVGIKAVVNQLEVAVDPHVADATVAAQVRGAIAAVARPQPQTDWAASAP